MALETGSYISDLVATNPTSSDPKSAGDDHLRLLKSTIKATFPNITGAVTATYGELNLLVGATTTGAVGFNVVTQSPGNNTTLAASTAFVIAQAFSTALPSQTGNSGKVITTNGTTASWGVIGTALQYLRVNAAGTALEGAALQQLLDNPDYWI